MKLLRNAVRSYAWGSRTALAELRGKPAPTDHPEAELWMGAHPRDPSQVLDVDGVQRSLRDVLSEDPVGQLGYSCAQRWGDRLPFMVKILAAEEPLSMQAHPATEQASEGYAREQAEGVPREAPERNYPDPVAKPELICALGEFRALAGFRDARRTVSLLRAIETPGMSGYTELLAAQPDADGLRALFTTWITLPQQALDELLPEVLRACAEHARADGAFATECRTVVELGHAHPGDAGVLAALLLNNLVLHAGDAIYLPPGNLHLYLRGTAVEVLANSDNVLRCGLTPKHVDVPELLRAVDFSSGPTPVLRGEPPRGENRVSVYSTEAPEFELSRLDWVAGEREHAWLPSSGARILVCTRGAVVLRRTDGRAGELELAQGDSAWLAASDPAVLAAPSASAESAQLFSIMAGCCS